MPHSIASTALPLRAMNWTLKLKGGFGILFRVYNEGVAYRFYTTHASEMTIKNELAEFNFSKDHAVYLPYSTNDQQPLAMAFQNIYDATTYLKPPPNSHFFLLPSTMPTGLN